MAAGDLTLTRDVTDGVITDATLGPVVTNFGYDGFGAVSTTNQRRRQPAVWRGVLA